MNKKDQEIFRQGAAASFFIDKEMFKHALYHNESDLVNALVSAWYHTKYTDSKHYNKLVAPMLRSFTDFGSYTKAERVDIIKDLFDWIPSIVSKRRGFAVYVQDFYSPRIVYQSFGHTYNQPRWLVDLGEIYNLGYTTRLRYEFEKIKRRFVHKPANGAALVQANRQDG